MAEAEASVRLDGETQCVAPTTDPLKPSLALLCKLGSIVVHAEEFTSPTGHHLDLTAMRTLFNDVEVRQWIKDMGPMMPVKR